ncbi:MAG: 2-hydroxyacid dehydrogenase [Pseudomonadota bacterium]
MSLPVLLRCPLMPVIQEKLEAGYDVHPVFDMADPKLEAIAGDIRAVVTGGHLGAPTDVMERLPNLEMVAINGVGFDKVDLDMAKERSIRVSNTPDVLTADVADLAIGLTLALTRKITEGDSHVRSGAWLEGNIGLGRKFSGLRYGIFGLGRIGKAIARRLAGFDVEIAYCDIAEQPDSGFAYCSSAAALAAEVDVLIVAAAASGSTEKIIGKTVLDALGKDGLLVNVARGSIVDEPALVQAITSGSIAGAALDVFADEPRVPAALIESDRVVLTPHIASGTVDTRLAMGNLMLANLEAFAAGKDLITPVV